ncbi:GGDEF domain-containing protein [Alkalimarinus sediminis]|uniref:diguanylate cyclase n=1 Tax=Alkalimarinus sediminis TaxID=1632866 RepID=A0A9E8HGK9_9ALTE|nr:GGDEF domain-containing protein [Alkalimarinus sediminis]UZW73817.1 GGDEF domain-containing protein [Alkalimarinus sediminis]
MTDFQLKNMTRATSYGLTALFMFFLAIQNYRYGYYDLVYTATLLMPLLGFGIAYTYAQRYFEIQDYAHVVLLAVMAVLITTNISETSSNATLWLYPIGLLSYLVLPFRASNIFNGAILFCLTFYIGLQQGLYSGLLFFTSYLFVSGIAGIFAYLHHHKNRKLIELSLHDPLTGAYNMKHLDDTLTKEISRSHVTGNTLSLIALRVDYFDQFTDVHGNNAAKELTVELSKVLGGMIRAGDSHYYSEESLFYLLLPNTPQEGMLIMTERVRRTVEDTKWQTIGTMTVSLGCTTSTQKPATAKSLRNEVHCALKDAESNGHNRVSLFNQP